MRTFIDLLSPFPMTALPMPEGAELLPVTFQQEVREANSGQTDMAVLATGGGSVMGKIDYSIFRGKIAIQMIKAGSGLWCRGSAAP